MLNITEVTKLISSAKENKIESLEISYLKHSNLPKEIGNLKYLRKLSLDYCDISTLPYEIGNLENLESLTINGCYSLTSIPRDILKLKRLHYLKIENCGNNFEIPRNLINNMISLKEIDFLNIDISGILEENHVLESLTIRGNNISEIPEEIKLIQNLKFFSINLHSLEQISDKIGDLTNLRYLSICNGHKLLKLPKNIGALKNLEELHIFKSGLSELPSTIKHLSNLKKLVITNTQLKSLPDNIGNLNNLNELYISKSELMELPSTIDNLINLNKLVITQSNLSVLPNEFTNLSNLVHCELSFCKLKSLPSKINKLKNLRFLYLNVNRFKSFPREILNLNNLNNLSLSNNKIEVLPDNIDTLISLTELNLSSNKLIDLPKSLFNLKTLEVLALSQNQLSKLSSKIKNLTNLKELYLVDNKLSKVPTEICKLEKLEILNLTKNSIKKIPKKIHKIKTLSVDYYYNFLERIIIKDKQPYYKALSLEIQKLQKKVWIPVVENHDTDILSSKFCGIPYLNKNEQWPICGTCKSPLQLFIQININDIPKTLQEEWKMDDGILQFFYCTNKDTYSCETENMDNDAFGNNFLIRHVLPNTGSSKPVIPEALTLYPEKKITGWEESYDYPSPWEIKKSNIPLKISKTKYVPFDLLSLYCDIEEEHILKALSKKVLGINYKLEEDDEDELTGELICEYLNRPLLSEKLSGWPSWTQNIEYPNCPLCGKQMKYILQIDSKMNIPYVFGDYGCGHITQCIDHKHIFGFKFSSH